MRKFRLFHLNNKGASLIAVLVAIVVVGVMGSVVMQLTITNLQMKEVERQGKKNFYSAEEFMGYLTNRINVQSANELHESFNEMLTRYKTVSQDELKLRKAFSQAYLKRMIAYYGDTSSNPSQKVVDEEVVYEINHYKVDVVKNLIYAADEGEIPDKLKTDTEKYGFDIDASQAYYYADYENATFTLSNVCVFAKDDFGNKNKIQTDIVFHVPDINLDGNNVVKEFMRYSLIADRQIELDTRDFTVDGNVYAGEDGIICNQNQYGKLIGKKIITRGDIVACKTDSDTHQFMVGNPEIINYTQIWADNYVTMKDDLPGASPSPKGARLIVSGDSYIADDLTVNGDSDLIAIRGNYYGYNFQENYNGLERTEDSKYSSAILINGKNAIIDVEKAASIMVAGRAFIGRNKGVSTGSNDILTGESISVKANQIAYYVPQSCLDDTDSTKIDEEKYKTFSGIPNVKRFLDSDRNVTEYHYRPDNSTAENIVYYLNFGSDQLANAFFFEYYNNKKLVTISKGNRYIEDDPLVITIIDDEGNPVSTTTYRSLQIHSVRNNPIIRGDYMYRDPSTNELDVTGQNILDSWWGEGSIYYNFSHDHAIRYKSLCLDLEDHMDPAMASKARITDADPTLFNNLIDSDQWRGFFAAHASDSAMTDGYKYVTTWTLEEGVGGASDTIVAVVNNVGEHAGTFTIDTPYTNGLVIAAGDVQISHSFRGTIISGGKILVDGSASLIQGDEILISKMISLDAALKHDAVFSKLFKGYAEVAEEIMSGTSVDKYMTFDNWTKTIE